MRGTAALAILLVLAFVPTANGADQRLARRRVAVLAIPGESDVTNTVAAAIAAEPTFARLDLSLVGAAAAGAGYRGSLNLTLDDARRLGTVIGAEFLVLGTASILDLGDKGGDAFVGLFLVDGRSGELLRFKGISTKGSTLSESQERALEEVRAEISEWGTLCARAAADRGRSGDLDERSERVDFVQRESYEGVTPPRFFKKPAPAMTAEAERAQVTATVDVVVEFNADGTFGNVSVVRWAGFGLDEATVEAVRRSTFWPAMRGRKAVPARALLRYNFRVRTEVVGAERNDCNRRHPCFRMKSVSSV